MERFDIVIVGGGPIGAVTAACAADQGSRVLLAEQRGEIQGPAPCTGLISPRTLSALGASTDTVLREIRGLQATAPDGRRIHMRSDRIKAVVVDRARLEQELLARAEAAGATIRMGTQVTGIDDQIVTVQTGSKMKRVSAGGIVGAEGPGSRVAAWSGLSTPSDRVMGIQAVIAEEARAPDEVDVQMSQTMAPTFFAWAVPAKPGQLRVGLGVPLGIQPGPLLERWLAAHSPGATEISRVTGIIPVSPVPRAQAGRVLLVGDAAGQVKPWSGGGLYTGALCARIAARAAVRGHREGLESLREYEGNWRRAIGSELRLGEVVRRVLSTVNDDDIDTLFAAADQPEILRDLANEADIDRPSRLVPHLLTDRRVWKSLWVLAPALRTWAAPKNRPDNGSSIPSPEDESL